LCCAAQGGGDSEVPHDVRDGRRHWLVQRNIKMIDAQRVVVTRPPTQVALAWLLAQGEKCLRQAGAVAICGFRPPRIWWMLRARTLDRQHGGSHG
jgi:aryl-alcohol dehydrogenase-like predicted oxidoreductase